MQARRVELERLLVLGLAQPERARRGARKPKVVDRLAALALEEHGRLEPERAEDRGVERERAPEIATHEIDMTQADEHQQRVLTDPLCPERVTATDAIRRYRHRRRRAMLSTCRPITVDGRCGRI